jgi:hypothetical protein
MTPFRALEQEVGLQKDIEEIRRLQWICENYNSSGLFQQAIDLVAPNAESIEICRPTANPRTAASTI